MSAPLTFPIRVRNPKTREMPMASSPPTTSHSTAMFPERLLKNPANGLRATEAPLRKPFVAKPPARVTWTFEIPPQRNKNPSAIRPKNIDQARPDFTSFPKTSSDHTLLSKSFSLETTVGYAPIGFTSSRPHRVGGEMGNRQTVLDCSRLYIRNQDAQTLGRAPAEGLISDSREHRLDGNEAPENDEQEADHARRERWPDPDLLDEDREGEPAHPHEAHRTRHEEDDHEEPAAADAVHRMTEAHPQGTEPARPPVMHHEPHRGLTMVQADLLRPGDLPSASGQEGRRGDQDGHTRPRPEKAEGHQPEKGRDAEGAPHREVR